MQSLNAVMTLSFLQAYADAVCLWSNTEVLERLEGGVRARSTTTDFGDINRHISQHMLGALWPLHPQEAFGGVSRIRDIVMSAAPDWTCKFVEPRTCFMPPPGAAGSGLSHSPWSDSLRALNGAYCKFDALDGNAPVVSTSSLLLARGFPPDQLPPGPSPAAASYVQLTQSHAHRPAMLLSAAQPPGGRNAAMAAAAGRGGRGGPAAGTWGPGGPASAHSLGGIGGEPAAALSNVAVRVGMAPLASSSVVAASETSTSRSVAHTVGPRGGPSVTSVCNRTSVVGLFSSLTQRAVRTVKAGAFMHWYERYGVTREAVLYAAQQVADVADCYRAAAAL